MASLLSWLGNAGNQVLRAIPGVAPLEDSFRGIHQVQQQQQRNSQNNTVNSINQATGGSPIQRAQQAPPPPPPPPIPAFTLAPNNPVVNKINQATGGSPIQQAQQAPVVAPHYVNPISAVLKPVGDITGLNIIAQHAKADAQAGHAPNPLGALLDVGAHVISPATNFAKENAAREQQQIAANGGHPLTLQQQAGNVGQFIKGIATTGAQNAPYFAPELRVLKVPGTAGLAARAGSAVVNRSALSVPTSVATQLATGNRDPGSIAANAAQAAAFNSLTRSNPAAGVKAVDRAVGSPLKNEVGGAGDKGLSSDQLAKNLRIDPASQKVLQKTPMVQSPQQALDMNVRGTGEYKAPEAPITTPASEKVRFPVSQLKTLEAQGNAGKALAQKTIDVQTTTDRLGAASEGQIPTVLKVTGKAESHNFQNVLRGTEAPINAKVGQAVKEWQAFSPSFRETGVKAGVRIGDRGPNYFPQNSNFAGDNYQNALDHLVNSGQAQDIGQATRMLDDIRSTPMSRKSSYFKPRTLDTGLNHDNVAAVARDYISQGSKNIAETTHYGRGLGKIDHLIGRIQTEGGDAQKARQIVKNLVAPEYSRSVGAKALRGGRQLMSASKLGTAVISHAGQPILNDTTRAGFGPTLKAYVTRYSKANRQLEKDTGINYGIERQRQLEQSVGSRLSKITAPGLTTLQKFNRGVAVAAGKYHAQDLVKRASRGDVKALDEMRNKLGIKGEIGSTLTPEQIIQAGRNEAVATHFSNNPAELPLFHSSELGKTVMQFRAAYGVKQTGFIVNEVLKEAQKGNFKPLTRFAVMAPIVGAGVYAGKQSVNNVTDQIFNGGKNQQAILPGSVLEAAAKGGGFGLPGSIAEGFKYVNNAKGKPDPTKTLIATASSVAPLAGEIAKGVVNTAKAIGGDTKPLIRQAVGEPPVVGGALANLVAPYGPKAPNPPGGNIAHAGGPSPLTLEQQVAQNKLDKSKDVNQNLKVSDYLTKDQQNFLKLTPQQQQDYLTAHPDQAYLARSADERRAAEQIIKGVHPNLPQGLDANSVKVLTNYDRLSAQGKDKFKDSPQNSYNLAQANFQKDVLSGKLNPEEQYTKQQSLAKLKIETGYSQEVSQLYGFSKTQLTDFFAKNPDKAGLFDQVKGLDKALSDAGLAKQKFEYGLGSKGRKATKGRTPKAPKIPKFAVPKTAKISQPKGVKIKSVAFKPYKPKKIAVSKMPRIG